MCGIAGIVDMEGQSVEPALLRTMANAIYHRGPDDEGYVFISRATAGHRHYSGPASPAAIRDKLPPIQVAEMGSWDVGLAHRRFSIVDLSSAGHQPLFSDDYSCCVVFNGEIYNYLELRTELEQQGVKFRSHSDTEVLIQAYRRWGTECFRRFNGFWALALFDFRTGELILSRDRLGKKPLYWTRMGDRLYFASEIKSLLAIPEVAKARRVNQEAVWHWCVDGRRDLENSTLFSGIQSLPAASWTVVDRDFPNKTRVFWEVPRLRLAEGDISISDAARSVRDLLDDAVRIRLRADVPLAIELSGGMDSSTVLALASKHHIGPVTTYTVKYPDARWDEEPFARSVASRYNVDYRVLQPELGGFWHQIEAFTHLHEEPYHSPNMHVSQVVWTMMRMNGTKVSLTGAAGDELFAGYAKYYWKAQTENLVTGHWGQLIDNARHWTEGPHKISGLAREIVGALRLRPMVRHIKGLLPVLENQFIQGIPTPHNLHHHATLSGELREDIVNTLIPYWLRSGEKNYMGIPFEARCPFLDHRVVELASRLPVTYLFRHGWHKWILRKAMEDLLPADVVWRRVKMGFPYPYERFFATYNDIVDIILARARNPYVKFSHPNLLRTNWKALSFILWYEMFINGNRDLFKEIERITTGREEGQGLAYVPEFRREAMAGANIAVAS